MHASEWKNVFTENCMHLFVVWNMEIFLGEKIKKSSIILNVLRVDSQK